jgi:hypothetical protein
VGCPIARALLGNVELEIDAVLEEEDGPMAAPPGSEPRHEARDEGRDAARDEPAGDAPAAS